MLRPAALPLERLRRRRSRSAPEGYKVKVPVNEAAQLAVESDVRISNVSVGRVKKVELEDEGENRDLAIATLEIQDAYAPIPEDTRAILRQKTLLGETYVELTQGDKDGPTLAEDGTLPKAQVSEAVQLDEIFRTFDEPTRLAFQSWMQNAAIALDGRGADLNAAIANLEPFAEEANKILRTLDTQDDATSQFVKNTGEVFGALSRAPGPAPGPDPELRHRLQHDRAAKRGPARDVQGAARPSSTSRA